MLFILLPLPSLRGENGARPCALARALSRKPLFTIELRHDKRSYTTYNVLQFAKNFIHNTDEESNDRTPEYVHRLAIYNVCRLSRKDTIWKFRPCLACGSLNETDEMLQSLWR